MTDWKKFAKKHKKGIMFSMCIVGVVYCYFAIMAIIQAYLDGTLFQTKPYPWWGNYFLAFCAGMLTVCFLMLGYMKAYVWYYSKYPKRCSVCGIRCTLDRCLYCREMGLGNVEGWCDCPQRETTDKHAD